MTKTKHDSNRELIGQGIGNGIAAIFGGIPGAGATIRTVVNIDAGGRTRLSGMIASIFLLVILLILGPYASQIPKAVLAGILITVGIGVMDYKGLRALKNMPKHDAIVLIIVLLLTVFWDLIFAVAIGLVLSALMFMKKMGDVAGQSSRISKITDEPIWKDELELPAKFKEEVFIKHMEGPLFFGSTSEFQILAKQLPSTAHAVVIRMDRVPYMDKSGFNTMEEILLDLIRSDIAVLIVGIQAQPKYLLEQFDVVPNLVSYDRIFDDFHDCSEWIKENIDDIYGPEDAL
jgi:SulP family sulfate permease